MKPRLLSSLIFVICFLSLSSARAQLPGHDSTHFESLKGMLALPVDRYTHLVNSDQVLTGTKRMEICICCGSTPTLTIQSDSIMTVKNVVVGEVVSIFEIDSTLAVFTKHGNYFLIYNNLNAVFVKKGDIVNPGQSIGKILKPSYNGLFELELLMSDNKARLIDPYPWFINSKFL